MCYIVAKNRMKHGCIACKTEHGKYLVELKRRINDKMKGKGIQVLSISRPMAYGEYAPYRIIDNLKDFEQEAYKL